MNVAFLHGMVAAARSLLGPERVGIYASESRWKPICAATRPSAPSRAGTRTGMRSRTLATFTRRELDAFGGWSKPTMKQYHGSVERAA